MSNQMEPPGDHHPPPSNPNSTVYTSQDGTRKAAVSLLKRAVSSRSPSPLLPLDSRSASASASSSTNSLSRSASLNAPPLERSASLLARQIAMAKLTGEALPTPPAEYLVPASLGGSAGGLRRGNTVTGVMTTPSSSTSSVNGGGEEERKEARTNLIRKLSERRPGGSPRGRGGATPAQPTASTPTPPSPPSNPHSEDDAWEFVDQLHPSNESLLHPSHPSNSSSSLISIRNTNRAPPVIPFPSPPTPPPPPAHPSNYRRSSIPSHLHPRTFGIAAVEDSDAVRRRGSSASSSVALGLGFGRERMDSMLPLGTTPSNGGSPLPGSPDGFGSPNGRGSVSGVGLGFSTSDSHGLLGEAPLEDLEGLRLDQEAEDLAHDEMGELEEEGIRKIKREEEQAWALRQRRLVAKVERKREEGLQRSRQGAFPPPEEGYTFPPTSPRSSEDNVGGSNGLVEAKTGLFAGGSSPPISSRRSPDLFLSSYLPLSLNDENSCSISRVRRSGSHVEFEEPLSPTSVAIPRPPAFLRTTSEEELRERENKEEEATPTPASISIFHAGPSSILHSPPLPVSPPLASTSPSPSTSPRHSQHRHHHSHSHSLSSHHSHASNSVTPTPLCAPRFATTTTPPTPTIADLSITQQFSSSTIAGSSTSTEMHRDNSSSSNESLILAPRLARLPVEHLPASRIIARLDQMLSMGTLDPSAPSALENPPRKLLLHAPVLQVVNVQTCKDRHLFLFSDLLLIAKPIIEDHPITGLPVPSTMENLFVVKSIVELNHLTLIAEDDEADKMNTSAPSAATKRNPLVTAFVDRFANDPKKAIKMMIDRGGLINDGPTIANHLFRHTELNRNALGAYLCDPDNRHILRWFIERFRFSGVRIDDALRMFLMSVRFPHTVEAAEYVLGVFALQWTDVNGSTGFDPSLTLSLVLAIMRLSDALHAGGSSDEDGLFSFPNGAISVDDFISAFREHDPRMLVPEELLAKVYASVRKERVEEASDNSIFSMTPDIDATIDPAKLPQRLTYRQPSELITITLPEPDPKFSIKLHGIDLKFDPPILSFAKSRVQTFRVTGCALGIRAMVLIKCGANAPRYQGLPVNKTFQIDRAFLTNVFQISFPAEERGMGHRKSTSAQPTPSSSQQSAPPTPKQPQHPNKPYLEPNRIPAPANARQSPSMTTVTTPADPKAPRAVTYMFSTLDAPIRRQWVQTIRNQIGICKSLPPPPTKALNAGAAVAVQVLRDTLIPPEEVPAAFAAAPGGGVNSPRPGTGGASGVRTPRGGRLGTPTRPAGGTPGTFVRSASFSKTYPAGIGKVEQDLQERDLRKPSTVAVPIGKLADGKRRPSKEDGKEQLARDSGNAKSGEEIRVVTEQNSLLPLVLGFLAIGAETAPAPLSLQGTAFQLPPLDASEAENYSEPLPALHSYHHQHYTPRHLPSSSPQQQQYLHHPSTIVS